VSTRVIGNAAWQAPATVRVTERVSSSGTGIGNPQIDMDAMQIDYGLFARLQQDLIAGNNSIGVPISATDLKATVCWIIPPRGNTVALILKGANGDTGIQLNPNGITRLTLSNSATPTAIIINANAPVTVEFMWA
jgi:hypothetical protein